MPTENNGRAPPPTAELLLQRLDGALPLEQIIVELLFDALQGFRRDLMPLAGQPLRQLVLSPTTDLAVLQTIKDHGKKLAAAAGSSESERNAGLAIYFTAIASALVFHGRKISTHSHASLAQSFASLINKPWATPELSDLFRQAQRICQDQPI